ncbi:hypothetical protein [Marivirga sp.]|uniref:hypothetical protein n=1 Tax=Marivirga sp. TaxID=2018662 RepID=UPI002D7F30DC|nr:hypothetical protein [Marivirga sp.]HET8858367.1 hypothetical protein [Marivirga sp.]
MVIFTFTACKDKMVCAAFQSSYILDKEEQRERFSLFKGDSIVINANASTSNYETNIYGISEKKYGYWKQQELLRVKQKEVYSDEVDSLLNIRKRDLSEMAEAGTADSVTQEFDSAQLADGADAWDNTKRFNYNVDFVKYMELVGNDVLLQQAADRDSAAAKAKREKVNQPEDSTSNTKDGFFKNLFKNKTRNAQDSTENNSPIQG